jgi:hypothetical protein
MLLTFFLQIRDFFGDDLPASASSFIATPLVLLNDYGVHGMDKSLCASYRRCAARRLK